MKLGITAFSTATGLGYQTKAYAKHLKPTKIMEIDLSGYNGMQQHNWYAGSYKVRGYPKEDDIREFLSGLEVVLFAETPLNYEFYRIARDMHVKTAVVVNWEFFDHIAKPQLPLPDLFIMPSTWHLADMQMFAARHNKQVVQIHHPVDRDEIPFNLRHAVKFLHIAGRPAINDRNGTHDFLQAWPVDAVVTTQDENYAQRLRAKYRHSAVYSNVTDQRVLYGLGNILVLPRRYGGNCLPLNEALAAGLPVIMPNIAPNNDILPKEWLVTAHKVGQFVPRTTIDLYSVDTSELRQKLDWFTTIDIKTESLKANKIADTISWQTLLPEYIKALGGLL